MKKADPFPAPDSLTPREIEIIQLIADGLSNGEIAQRLVFTVGTVKWYNTQIFDKLGVKNRTQAIVRARELGFLGEDGESPADEPPSLDVPQNLPIPSLPFVGREAELTQSTALLTDASCRLLSMVGPGGIGKTSLAIETAGHCLRQFNDGVYFVPLVSLHSPADLIPAIANTIGLSFKDGIDPHKQFLDYLRDRQMLLVLDNFEHLLDGVSLLSEILASAAGIKLLVTSRERLNLQEETLFRVEGMLLPDQNSEETLLENEAMTLFQQNAQRVRPDFEASAEDMRDIARICCLVEGMPLGILLAAAWIELLSPAEIADEISKSLDFLQTEIRNLPERHRSVRAVFESAWNMLSEAEQAVFARLSVLRGGFTREAAEVVAGADLRTLMTLVNKSLLSRNRQKRYEVHELLRQYAGDMLEQSGLAENAYRIHWDYYLTLLMQRGAEVSSPEALDAIEADFENIRSAWHRAAERHQFEVIQPALEAVYQFCTQRSRSPEAERFFDQAIRHAEEMPEGPLGLMLSLREYRGNVRSLIGAFEGAAADLQLAREAARAMGDLIREQELLILMGGNYRKADRQNEALQCLNMALQNARSRGDQRAAADVLYHLGTVSWDDGNNRQTRRFYDEAVAICRALPLNDKVAVQALHGMGETLFANAEPHLAIRYFSELGALARQIGDVSYDCENGQMIGWASIGNIGLGDYAAAQEKLAESLVISEAAHFAWHSMCSTIGLGLARSGTGDYQQGIATVQNGIQQAEALNVARMKSVGWESLGQLYQDLRLLEQATAAHQRGLEIALTGEVGHWLPRLQASLAIDRLRQGDLSVGAELEEALGYADRYGQNYHLIRCLEGLAELHIARNEPQKALVYADRLLALAEPRDLREMIAQAHRWRGETFLLLGRLPQAESELQLAVTQAAEIGKPRLRWDVHAALARVFQASGQAALAEEQQAVVRQIVGQIADRLSDKALRAGLNVD